MSLVNHFWRAVLALGTAHVGDTSGFVAGAPVESLGFDVPPGYVERREGGMVVLAPVAAERTPCVYGLAPPRPSTGRLEADAESALVQVVVPGWRRLDDRHAALRGTAPTGWPYVWYRAAFEGELGGGRQAVNAMAMVLPAGPGRVHVVWGIGSIARCLLDDASFEQLFHGLRPGGWRSDGGAGMARAIVGAWRFAAGTGVQQLRFAADGRFERDVGSRARLGAMEQVSATATGGRFTLRHGELALVPDHRPGDPDRYRARIHDEWLSGAWRRALVLLTPGEPSLVIPFHRIEPDR